MKLYNKCGSRVWRAATVGALASIGAAALASCGSSPSTPTVPSKAPYRLGASFDLSGNTASVGQPEAVGVRAAVAGVNASGGINGHKIDLYVVDDQDTSAATVSTTNALLTADHVNAIIGVNDSIVSTDMAPIVTAAKVPMISDGVPASLVIPARPYIFTHDASAGTQAIAEVDQIHEMVKLGELPANPKIGVAYLATPSGASWLGGAQAEMQKYGYSVAASAPVPLGTSDYSPEATRLASAHLDVTIAFLAAPFVQGLVTALNAAGASQKMWLIVHSAGESATFQSALAWPKYAALELWQTAGTGPAFKTLASDAAKLHVSPSEPGFMIGYAEALLIFNGYKACGYPCSGRELETALNRTDTNLGGIAVAPMKFSASQHSGATGAAFVQWSSTRHKLVILGKIIPLKN